MFIGDHAARTPDRPAVIIAETGETLTYAQLNDNSNRIAQMLAARGFQRGDVVAVLMENHLNYLEVVWAALRSGLYVVCLNRYGTAEDVAYILNDSGARAIFASEKMRTTAAALGNLIPDCPHRFILGKPLDGWEDHQSATSAHPAEPLVEEWMGNTMAYTSGTTGRPKGVERPLPDLPAGAEWFRVPFLKEQFGFEEGMHYYAPAPMYHGAPQQFMRAVHCLGGTVVQVQKFDEMRALAHIEAYKITHTQMVPTMFVRMLKLPAADRDRFDLSSLKRVVHSAAPCPRDVKQAMIDWVGPIVDEYYGATDGGAMIPISCADWLAHPGAAGRPLPNTLKICRDDGSEAAPGESGLIYFVHPPGKLFTFRNDPEKTQASRHPVHPNWTTSGDIGRLDDDGFLYLTDRKAFMIISGGVNIYPQMIEDALITHDAVQDVAVFGVPNPEMGEEVKAVVELMPGQVGCDRLRDELMDYVGGRVAAYMRPKSLDFVDALPRTPTGKLLKKQMQAAYWSR